MWHQKNIFDYKYILNKEENNNNNEKEYGKKEPSLNHDDIEREKEKENNKNKINFIHVIEHIRIAIVRPFKEIEQDKKDLIYNQEKMIIKKI